MNTSHAIITSKSANKRGKKQKLEPIIAPVTTFVILDGKRNGSQQQYEPNTLVHPKAKAAELENVELTEAPLITSSEPGSTTAQPSRNLNSITDME